MINENEKRLKQKIEFFKEEKVEVHVKLNDKTFLNGFVDKEIKPGVYWFIDNKLGGVYLFLKDLYEVVEFNRGGGE